MIIYRVIRSSMLVDDYTYRHRTINKVVNFVDVTPRAGALELRGSHGGDFAKIPSVSGPPGNHRSELPKDQVRIWPWILLPCKLAVCRPAERNLFARQPAGDCTNADFLKRLRGALGAL
jgi:hypothetical protein